MVGDMRIGRVDADGFTNDLGQWAPGAHTIVKDVARSQLITVENAILKLRIHCCRAICRYLFAT